MKKYRRYRRMTEEEQRTKFGFSQMDLMKRGEWLNLEDSQEFERACLIQEDIEVEE